MYLKKNINPRFCSSRYGFTRFCHSTVLIFNVCLELLIQDFAVQDIFFKILPFSGFHIQDFIGIINSRYSLSRCCHSTVWIFNNWPELFIQDFAVLENIVFKISTFNVSKFKILKASRCLLFLVGVSQFFHFSCS